MNIEERIKEVEKTHKIARWITMFIIAVLVLILFVEMHLFVKAICILLIFMCIYSIKLNAYKLKNWKIFMRMKN